MCLGGWNSLLLLGGNCLLLVDCVFGYGERGGGELSKRGKEKGWRNKVVMVVRCTPLFVVVGGRKKFLFF